MKNLFKKIKWFVKVAVVFGLLSVSNIQMLQVVLADDASEEEPVIRTQGAQRINTNHLLWTPVSETNPLGGADDFNAILFDSFINFNETGGPVAAGRFENIKIVTFEENLIGGTNQFDDYAIPRFNVGMIAQNGITGTKTKIHNGDVVISEQQYGDQTERSSGNSYIRQAAINTFLSDAKADLVNLQNQLWELPTTGDSATNEWGQITFTADKKMNILELNQHERSSLHIDNIAIDGTIIMKVNTNQLNLNTIFINGVQINQQNINQIANRLLWVFDPSITDLRFNQTNLIGSVLAPTANIRFVDGYSTINGTLIANHLSGEGSSSELHYVGRYIGKLPGTPEPPTVPDTSTTEPSSTESSIPDPSTTESSNTGSSTTEPSVTTDSSIPDPSTTDPSSTDSSIPDPSTTDPSSTDSSIPDPSTTEPSNTGSSTTEPSVTTDSSIPDPSTTDPSSTDSSIPDPSTIDPSSTDSSIPDPSTTDPS
ncbi:MAG: choice-of-anchor A family protein, partial [Enterococcus sp.]